MSTVRSQLARFELAGPHRVPNGSLTRLQLHPVGEQLAGVESDGDCIAFRVAGWFEVLLTVDWDSNVQVGHRFSHTAIPDSHPLHSEAIEARVLTELSDGKQLLRGNTIFEPGSTVNSIALEVWQDSGDFLAIANASLEIRPFDLFGA
jgi:hypothetical protein